MKRKPFDRQDVGATKKLKISNVLQKKKMSDLTIFLLGTGYSKF